MDVNPCSILMALFAALRAGESILSVYDNDLEIEYKDDSSPLTLADRKAHDIIAQTLSAGRPDWAPILSEEGKTIPYTERKNWWRFWLVDPLDGTKEFIKRNGEFTVNIALVDGNQPVAGVIYAPVIDMAYFAGKGLGAYKISGVELSAIFHRLMYGYDISSGETLMRVGFVEKNLDPVISAATLLKTKGFPEQGSGSLKIIGSRSHSGRDFHDFVEGRKMRYNSVELVSAGSSLKFCHVAEGKADLYPRFWPTMEWDTGAGDIIVKEAGGKVINLVTGGDLIYNKQELLNPSFMAMSNRQLIIA